MAKHFIILIGGPGKFQGCDKAHDQTWTNYNRAAATRRKE